MIPSQKKKAVPSRCRTPILPATLALVLAGTSAALAQGSLTPSGAPEPLMKTLAQIEPRRDLLTLPGDANAQYIISEPGSYYLSTNIFGVINKSGIAIRADNVTLDLCGFALIGGQFSLNGITGAAGFHTNCTVVNGIVSGWTNGYGVYLANLYGGRLENLVVANNNYAGILSGNRTVVQDCTAQSNRGDGIIARSDCIVRNCVASGNAAAGISVGSTGARIEGNVVNKNGFGIRSTGSGNLIIKNQAVSNSGGSNYVFSANDVYGPAYGMIPGVITTNNPWANFFR